MNNLGLNLYNWLELLLIPMTSIVTWFAASRQRNNSTLQKLQTTIDMLVHKNAELYKQLAEVRSENAKLKEEQNRIRAQQDALQSENARLHKQISLLKKHNNIKTK